MANEVGYGRMSVVVVLSLAHQRSRCLVCPYDLRPR